MRDFAIDRGELVQINGRPHRILHVLDTQTVVATDLETGISDRYDVNQLKPPESAAAPEVKPELSLLEEPVIAAARRRLAAVKPLLDTPRRPRKEVEQVAARLGVDATTVYRWMRQYRATGRLSSLAPPKPTGGAGKSRLGQDREVVIQQAIEHVYLQRQRPTIKVAAEYVVRIARNAGLRPPSMNTVRSRILAIDKRTAHKRRGHSKVVEDRFTARPGRYTDAERPLAVAQIDHTKLSNIIVDREHRLSIGRPWLTLVLDVHSRMVLGFCLSLEAPSTLTAGLALCHAILPKEQWLERHGLKPDSWPCYGFPARIHMDNGPEFHGEALRRACEEYKIEIDHRPVATPHFGAHIERMFRTLESGTARIAGRTFSKPSERGDYDPEHTAVMTLDELEGWIGEWITGVYHQRVHDGMKVPPIKAWNDAILGSESQLGAGLPRRPADEERLRIDFLPVESRTIQNYGVRMFNINYFSDALKAYIAPPGSRKFREFTFRYDPRDISIIYFWDPELKRYFPTPYRNTSHPPISVWELNEITRRLKQDGRDAVDEDLIFKTLENLEKREKESTKRTTHARRKKERKRAVTLPSMTRESGRLPTLTVHSAEVAAFDVEDA